MHGSQAKMPDSFSNTIITNDDGSFVGTLMFYKLKAIVVLVNLSKLWKLFLVFKEQYVWVYFLNSENGFAISDLCLRLISILRFFDAC